MAKWYYQLVADFVSLILPEEIRFEFSVSMLFCNFWSARCNRIATPPPPPPTQLYPIAED